MPGCTELDISMRGEKMAMNICQLGGGTCGASNEGGRYVVWVGHGVWMIRGKHWRMEGFVGIAIEIGKYARNRQTGSIS